MKYTFMFEFHHDRRRYFDIQAANAGEHVIPFIESEFPLAEGMRVLEIGAGEGGVLKSFIDRGCTGVAVELMEARVENGCRWLEEEIAAGKLRFLTSNIYDVTVTSIDGPFDIIILKDVIEHIPRQGRLLWMLRSFLKTGGVIFVGFPPWQMPFGGHQQMCEHFLSKAPYIHLLPSRLYTALLKAGKESPQTIRDMLEVKATGLSIEGFERIVCRSKYEIVHQAHYLLNPIYQYKFSLKARLQFRMIRAIPVLRNYLTTCVYYLLRKKAEQAQRENLKEV